LALDHAGDAVIRREPAAARGVCVALATARAGLMDDLDNQTYPF
jgi:hypothetical protein